MRDFELERFFATWEFAARHHMTASDAESVRLSALLALGEEAQRAAFHDAWLGYTETQGAPALRQALAQDYAPLGPEHILCFAGAEEGLYVAMHCLLGAADHAIVVVPNYQAAETLPLSLCATSGLALLEDPSRAGGWRLDLEQLASLIQPNTKLISVNFPHNPTGFVPTQAEFQQLIALCRHHGIWLFSDEVYRGLELDASKRLPHAAQVYERALSLNVFSKSYGLPGLRIGWIACQDTQLLERLNGYKHYLSICNAAPSEHLALIAVGARETIWARNRAIIAENLKLLQSFMGRYADLFDFRPPDGGCVAYPRYLGGDTDAYCQGLLERSGVLLLPPALYRSELMEQCHQRFRIGLGRKAFADGLKAWEQDLQRSL